MSLWDLSSDTLFLFITETTENVNQDFAVSRQAVNHAHLLLVNHFEESVISCYSKHTNLFPKCTFLAQLFIKRICYHYKGIVFPKIKSLPSFSHSPVIPNSMTYLLLWNMKTDLEMPFL